MMYFLSLPRFLTSYSYCSRFFRLAFKAKPQSGSKIVFGMKFNRITPYYSGMKIIIHHRTEPNRIDIVVRLAFIVQIETIHEMLPMPFSEH